MTPNEILEKVLAGIDERAASRAAYDRKEANECRKKTYTWLPQLPKEWEADYIERFTKSSHEQLIRNLINMAVL